MAQVMANKHDGITKAPVKATAAGDQLPGGWEQQELTDPDIKDKAKFAVDEHNKKQPCKKLVFDAVTNAQKKKMAGANYRLTISVDDGEGQSVYDALVFQKSDGTKTLKSFTKLN